MTRSITPPRTCHMCHSSRGMGKGDGRSTPHAPADGEGSRRNGRHSGEPVVGLTGDRAAYIERLRQRRGAASDSHRLAQLSVLAPPVN